MAIDTKKMPLIILGFDAGDPGFIQRWESEGHLPAIASIMQRGCWGQTAGVELVCERSVWVSLFSGMSPGQHGYYFFRQLKPRTYDLQTVIGGDVDARPFWAGLQGCDKKVAVIDVPDVTPLEGLSGLQLANWGNHNSSSGPSTQPARLLQDVSRVFGSQIRIAEKVNSTVHEDLRIRRRLLERIQKKGALCRYLLSQDRFDLVVVVFSESHVAGHQFWKYRPGAEGGQGAVGPELTHAIRDVYQEIDRQMGLLLARLPSEANVFIVSSTGMKDQYPNNGLIEAFCRTLGYQAPSEKGPSSLKPVALIRRTMPETWRTAISRYLTKETRERLLADQFRRSTNWRRTIAFPIPSIYTSFVRVNLQGREPEGVVEPGAEYEALLDRLEGDLMQLVDPETGEPAVKHVTKTGQAFHCGPPQSLPDLFVEWKPASHFMRRVVHPRAELGQPKPEFFRGSDHSHQGFFAAAGPLIQRRGGIGDISLLDLAPTFLSLVGEPVPKGMTGRVIETASVGA